MLSPKVCASNCASAMPKSRCSRPTLAAPRAELAVARKLGARLDRLEGRGNESDARRLRAAT